MATTVEVRKRKGENSASFIFRFNKKLKYSGLMKEVRKRRFRSRPVNRRKRKQAALYRMEKQKEMSILKKHGFERRNK